ncbi:MAG TPA: hypothetical protein VGR38_02310 [Candidatus Polarisedimenticolia bacterium]|nr:hypothetical protein [Candidatus Polarisedimenticolia bacterium]
MGFTQFLHLRGGEDGDLRNLLFSPLTEAIGVDEHRLRIVLLGSDPAQKHLECEESFSAPLQEQIAVQTIDFDPESIILFDDLTLEIEREGLEKGRNEIQKVRRLRGLGKLRPRVL